MEKVSRFDRKTLRGVHRLFRGVHFYLGGCKRQRGCSGKIKLDTKGCIIGHCHV